jgi:DNA-binding response OmpR family regulator
MLPMTTHRVLIIEDEVGLTNSLCWYFSKEGYETLVASNGTAGLAQARATIPDVVLLDVMLPGMDGFEVCRALRADPRTQSISIVLMSAKAEESTRNRGLSLGADDFVPKPFSNRFVLEKVKAILQRAGPRE